jgi:hypothetical protein
MVYHCLRPIRPLAVHLANFLTACSRIQLVKKLSPLHATQKVITVLTEESYVSLFWDRLIQFVPLSFHLRLGFLSGLLPPDRPTKIFPVSNTCHMLRLSHLVWFYPLNNLRWELTTIKSLFMQFSPSSYFLLLRSSHVLQYSNSIVIK